MSWLIESYLEEGKHGPDHPESLNMKNMEDMRKKHEDINRKKDEEKENDSDPVEKLLLSAHDKKHHNMYNKVSTAKDADIAGKKAILKGSDYDEAKEDYIRNKINKTEDKQARNRKILDDYAKKHYNTSFADYRNHAAPSLVKSIRRHEEKNEKRSNNECAWIVESLQ